MSANCTICTWTGGPLEVRDGGRCPECGEPIRYDSRPMRTAPRLDIDEFNHRAAKALRGIAGTESNPFLAAVLPNCEQGMQLEAAQQNGLYKTVLRLADSIFDRAVVEFATFHAKGYCS